MKSAFNRSILALAAIALVAGASQVNAQQKPLKKYDSGTKEFWTHPPDDWFLGEETEAQKGLAPPSGPPTGSSEAELAAMMKKIKLPAGFKIEVYAPGVLAARQMAWGGKGTAGEGLGRQGHAVRRLVRPRQRLCHHRQWRQERGQDRPQGPEHADRPRVQGRRAVRHRRRQADQIRERRSQPRQARRRQGGV